MLLLYRFLDVPGEAAASGGEDNALAKTSRILQRVHRNLEYPLREACAASAAR